MRLFSILNRSTTSFMFEVAFVSLGFCFACDVFAAPPGAAEAETTRKQLAAEISTVDSLSLKKQLLINAQEADVDSKLAHWYSGEINTEGQWLSIDDAERQASKDARLVEYRQRRASMYDRPVAHEKLARWCQKQGLLDQADVHWMHVLRLQPQHRSALKELDLRWYHGQLLAREEVDGYQAKEKEFLKQQKLWRSKAKRLRKSLEQNDLAKQIEVKNELRQINEPAAVPALLDEFAEEGATEQKTVERQIQLMEILGSIDHPTAVETLLTFAVRSRKDSVRYAAINQLKSKPYSEYVPTLLAELKLPIEASVSIHSIGNRIVNSYSYGQEGPGNQVNEQSYHSYRTVPVRRYNRSPVYRVTERVKGTRKVPIERKYIPVVYQEAYECGGRTVPGHYRNGHFVTKYGTESYESVKYEQAGTFVSENLAFQASKQRTAQKSQKDATAVGQQIARLNQAALIQNHQIAEVLNEVTGETLDTYPKSWWNWWRGYLDNHPDVAASGTRQWFNAALLNQSARGLARGTWVWTLEGLRTIEQVLPGDMVLSQDPETGELAYKAVVAIDVPRELSVNKLSFGSSSIHCVPGHVAWQAGFGWRRVSKLGSNDSLHGVDGAHRLTELSEFYSIDCYDLIVDGFHTFFVGESGILMHDATPIQPAFVALPGFSPAAVAHAAQLAAVANQ